MVGSGSWHGPRAQRPRAAPIAWSLNDIARRLRDEWTPVRACIDLGTRMQSRLRAPNGTRASESSPACSVHAFELLELARTI
jgi:hypothetical protein